MVFVDSNVPMYLIGNDAAMKRRARTVLERAIRSERRLVTSAEVFQEVLHRYGAIDRRDAIGPCFEVLLAVADEVLAVEAADVLRAREVMDEAPTLSARDALHVSVMERAEVATILSFDTGFDAWTHISRES